jgi:hypothetical protein
MTDDPIKIGKCIKSLTYQWATQNNLLNNYDKHFTIKFFSRFFQYWDKRVVIYFNNSSNITPIFTIIWSNGRCIPYNSSTINLNKTNIDIKVGSFLVTFNYYFIAYHYQLKNDKTVIDCIGNTSDFTPEGVKMKKQSFFTVTRDFLLRLNEKRSKGIKPLLTYDPNINRGTYIISTMPHMSS